MAVVVDASSPAIATAHGTTAALATASFTPPTGSLLVSVSMFGQPNDQNTGNSSTMSDSLSGTWTSRITQTNYGTYSGQVFIHTRVIGSSAAMTVTATFGGLDSGGGADKMLAVFVLTGADTSSIGTTKATTWAGGTTSWTTSVTTTAAGSLVLGGIAQYDGAAGRTLSLGSNTSWPPMSGTDPYDANFQAIGSFKGTSTTGTPGATTFGLIASGSNNPAAGCFLEALASTNQNISAADSSSPAADSAGVQANIAGADTGTGADTAGVSTAIAAGDTGTATEAVPKITIPAAELAAGDEATKVLSGGATLAFASDAATSAESTALRMGANDSMAYLETSIVAIQGPLPPGPRIVRIFRDGVANE